jgi:hypothetical protein
MTTTTLKICTRCDIAKPLTAFNKEKRGKYGVGSKCRECQRDMRDEARAAANAMDRDNTFKTCPVCTESKPLREYDIQPLGADGHRIECRSCTEEGRRLRKAGTPRLKPKPNRTAEEERDRWKGYQLRYFYNITVAEWRAMWEAQDGKCALCSRALELWGGRDDGPHVDHDHNCCPGNRSCGKCLRKMLCANCNMGIGLLGDAAGRLLKAARYIADHRRVAA